MKITKHIAQLEDTTYHILWAFNWLLLKMNEEFEEEKESVTDRRTRVTTIYPNFLYKKRL